VRGRDSVSVESRIQMRDRERGGRERGEGGRERGEKEKEGWGGLEGVVIVILKTNGRGQCGGDPPAL